MAEQIIVRIGDVQGRGKDCNVVYTIEDLEVSCVWEGPTPTLGEVYAIDPDHPGKNARKIAAPEEGTWTPECDGLRWKKRVSPTSKLTRMEILRRRHTIRRAVRDYFDGQGFIEIDAPLLVRGTSPDLAIDSFKVNDRYLISSTEYQIKRMAVGGFSRLYSLTKNFRYGDASRARNPEFSMLEWGGVDRTLSQIENDAEYMVSDALEALGISSTITYQDQKIDLTAPWDRIPVLEAIERLTGSPMRGFDLDSCTRAAKAAGLDIHTEWADDRDFIFSLLMDQIQPMLGTDKPVFLTEWPIFQVASAAADPDNPEFAQRSELFIGGVEVADGFKALADANRQEEAFRKALEVRIAEGKESVDLDERYIDALKLGSPYGAGMALGFDRLVMILTNQSAIKNVLAFAWDEV